MPAASRRKWLTAVVIVWCLSAVGMGCQTCRPGHPLLHAGKAVGAPCPECRVPKEMRKVTMPNYVIEPPDILLIDAVRLIPKSPYRIESLDTLIIEVPGTPLTNPISGLYPVDPDGTVNLGPPYGVVRVAGLTLEEAEKVIEKHLKDLKDPKTFVQLGQSRGLQQIRGEHLVRPDGTVSLGTYGDVRVVGLNMVEAKTVLQAHLTQFLDNPEISLDVAGYNSKVYYVITDGAGAGEQVFRFPITGNETVLDAVAQINGLPFVASKKRIWVARPLPGELACCCQQTLPVNWKAITRAGDTRTNYQLLPGDRLYVDSAPLIQIDTYLARVTAPFERLFGATVLGVGTIQSIKAAQGSIQNQGGGLGFFGGGFGF